MSELQQLEDSYRRETFFNNVDLFQQNVVLATPNPDRDSIRRINFGWEEKLKGICSSVSSIGMGEDLVRVYKRKCQSIKGDKKGN